MDTEKPRLSLKDIVQLPQREEKPEINQKIDGVVAMLKDRNVNVNPFIVDYLKDPHLFEALPDNIKNSDNELAGLIENMGKFQSIIIKEREKRWSGDLSGLLSEEISIPETQHAGGRQRRAESGYKINVDYLKSLGLDPKKILFFRVTQPSLAPKPEYYWTSDYFETMRGLTIEIPPEQRKTSIILVADLETINQNDGLIQDINDDEGLPVRQIGTAGFDQTLAIAKIEHHK